MGDEFIQPMRLEIGDIDAMQDVEDAATARAARIAAKIMQMGMYRHLSQHVKAYCNFILMVPAES